MPAKPLLDAVAATVARHAMFEGASCALLAVSGGPDSLALLHLLRALRDRDYPAMRLHVGHLHHGMRGAVADADAQFVAAQAAALGVGCAIECADVPGLARERGIGVEEAGREARYAFLTRLARAIGADRIATGHHADDQAETLLMRVRRGAGPRGMGGIPYVREIAGAAPLRIVRPLLDCARAEIEAFLRLCDLRARLDITNLSPHYLRNRMRARVLPALEAQWGPSLRGELCRIAAIAQRLQRQAERLIAPMRSLACVEPEQIEAPVEALNALPRPLRVELLRDWMHAARFPRAMLSRTHYEALLDLIEAGEGALSLPGGVFARRYRGQFALLRTEAGEWRHALAVPGRTPLPQAGGAIEAELFDGGMETLARRAPGGMEEFMDFDRLTLPLEARAVRPGDRMRPLGAPGSRKAQDIFVDLRVPSWRRGRTPVVTMSDRPIWIVGLRIADAVKLTPATRRVLRLAFVAE